MGKRQNNIVTIRRRMARNYARLLRELAAMDAALGRIERRKS